MLTSSKIYQGDCLKVLKMLPSNSVHCCVTSPPYFRLRDYECDGQLGSESTIEEFVANLVAVFEEVKRVLHPSGTLWLNLGDSYAAGGSYCDERKAWTQKKLQKGWNGPPPGLKRKDLCGAPWRVALALQAAGWYLRADCIWYKRNAMPGSYDDRPITCHEYVFLLTKSEHYFYDNEAVRQLTGNESTWDEYLANNVGSWHDHGNDDTEGFQQAKTSGFKVMTHPNGRNLRTVWDIPSERGVEGHFASFPKKLPELCIKAGTSEKGCCATCGAPWIRTFKDLGSVRQDAGRRKRSDAPGAELSKTSTLRTGQIRIKKPMDWKPDCKCAGAWPVPCTVLDPFSGTATTGLVASNLLRNYVGIELHSEYVEISRRRLSNNNSLLNKVEVIA